MPQIPAPVSLDNTLNGMDPNTLIQALQAEQAQQLAQSTQQATYAASQAGQQYQQAAASPSPDIGAAAAFIPTLLSNIASVIGQNPSYAENTQEGLKGQRATLLKNRADNLQALQDVWKQKADVAQAAGDTESREKALTKHEQISKSLMDIHEKQRHENAMSEISARAEAQKGINAAKPAGGGGVYGQAFSQTDPAAIAKGIESGDLPPNLTQYSRLAQGPVATILAKDGFKLGRAQQDFSAVQRHFATLNGRLQLQIRQSANTVLRGLDDVQTLAKQAAELSPQSRNTPLNRLLVKGSREWGLLTPDAQNTLTELNGQVATLIPELSNIYSAGGVPTTEAMKLAKQTLSADWPLNRILAGINRERANIQYRVNSINQVGAATPSSMESGGYTPPAEQGANTQAVEEATVLLQAPDGSKRMVKPSQVPGLIKMGAKKVAK